MTVLTLLDRKNAAGMVESQFPIYYCPAQYHFEQEIVQQTLSRNRVQVFFELSPPNVPGLLLQVKQEAPNAHPV